MSKQDGGPAFPAVIPSVWQEAHGKAELDYSESGMTLRDYFAAKAMQGHIASIGGLEGDDVDYVAEMAYKMSDAMVKARDR